MVFGTDSPSEIASIITGMLVDEEIVDFLQLLTDADYFWTKAKEAKAAIGNNAQIDTCIPE